MFKNFSYKEKPYSYLGEAKMKIGDIWIDVIIYMAEYTNPDGRFYVREKGEFFKLFKPEENETIS